MRLTVSLALVVAVLAACGGTGSSHEPSDPPGTYIVVLRDDADPVAIAAEHAASYGVEVAHVYTSALRGYAGRIPAARLAAVRADPRVRSVEADQPVRTTDGSRSRRSDDKRDKGAALLTLG